MLTVFLILLREGLEAALVVGIVVGYLIKVGRRDALRWVWIGIVAALLVSLGLGALVFITIGDLPSTIQEPIEGIAAVFAVGVLTWMLFWMRRQGRALKGELEGQLDAALQAGSASVLEYEVEQSGRILGEVENVIPGINRTFTLNLKLGAYVLNCPGGTSAATGILTVRE